MESTAVGFTVATGWAVIFMIWAAIKNDPKKVKAWAAIALICTVIASVSWVSAKDITQVDSKTDTKSVTSYHRSTPNLEVIEKSQGTGSDSNYIVGKIRNNDDKEYKYVQVSFNLYDKEGNQVGTAMANTTNLEAKGTWKFRALVIEKDTVRFELKDITGY